MSWGGIITFFSDAHTVLVFIGGTLGLVMQVAIWRKGISTGKGVQRNETAIHSLHRVVDDDIRHEITVLKKQQADIQRTTTQLENLIERRNSQTANHPGRRATDPRTGDASMRAHKPPKVVEPIHDPKRDGVSGWPIP